ncbi:MAG: YegS/Rv2252/BmrU family lipid kinase [Bacteroidales bacterium]|nr:YegS/Rv2252/BmrU family lipid kinase [Bacteroidales bacterium]
MVTEGNSQSKVTAILHGKKKVSKELAQLFEALRTTHNLEIKASSSAKQHGQIAREAQENRADTVLVAGGDGSFHEVINGFDFTKKVPKLIFIAAGTGNDFLRGLKMNADLQRVFSAISDQKWQPIDLIQADIDGQKVNALNIADLGFGGYVISLMRDKAKKGIQLNTYALAILKAFVRYKSPTVLLKTEEKEEQLNCFMLAVCNGSTFGNGLVVHPNARVNDGLLNFTLVGDVSVLDYIKQLKHLKKGSFIQHPKVSYSTGKKIQIEILSGKAFLEMDGEYYAVQKQLSFEVLPAAFELLTY